MIRTVFSNEHEPNVITTRNWFGNITVSNGDKTDVEVYSVDNVTRIQAKNELLQIAKRLKGQLSYMRAFS